MLSDESSSDSETGRFKCRTKPEDDSKRKSQKEESFRSLERSRPGDGARFRRDFDRKRDDRDRFERRSRERRGHGRHSPIRRRNSRDRSPRRRSPERNRDRPVRQQVESRPRSKPRDNRSSSKDKTTSRSRSHKPQDHKRDLKEELKRHIKEDVKPLEHTRDLKEELKRHLKDEFKPTASKEKSAEKFNRKSRDKSSSPDYKGKRSVIQRPTTSQKKRSHSPIVVEDRASSEEVQLGSYYSMIPAVVKDKTEVSPEISVVKEKSDESSEIDSSDDERLRAKLLNLEKELQKTRKKKHKKKHKRKSKSGKEVEVEPSTVEVSSTTDIDKADVTNLQSESAEVSSTQKTKEKESSEEGEINSDEDTQDFEIDPTDLRHKLKRSKTKISEERISLNPDICGPALPPHLQQRYGRSKSREIEGPALPPHLKEKTKKNIGPAIPDDLRKVLAEREPVDVNYVSSDEDVGIGPLPAGTEEKWSDAHKRLEERALDMKIKKLEGSSAHKSEMKSREEWMLELPEGKAKYLGLEARGFRAKAGPDMSDRSSWTDTPEEKARKAAGLAKEEDADVVLQREARARHIANHDQEQEQAVKKHKKKHKREESLLEMHEKKIKKKKKKDEKEGKTERRPFSRDVDLQVNRFDEAQKKSIIKKAQDLDSRFGRGEAKYL